MLVLIKLELLDASISIINWNLKSLDCRYNGDKIYGSCMEQQEQFFTLTKLYPRQIIQVIDRKYWK